MFMHREEMRGNSLFNLFSPSQNRVPKFSATSCSASAPSLGTKDVGIMKGQTGHQLFKVTQAPVWR